MNSKFIPEYDYAIRPQNLGPLLMKSSQSNFNLWSPDFYSARSYQIATVNEGVAWMGWDSTFMITTVSSKKDTFHHSDFSAQRHFDTRTLQHGYFSTP